MQKSVSQPNLVAYHGAATKGGLRKSISTNALPEMTVMDAVIMTKAPVNQAASCLMSSVDFPEHILSGKVEVDKELVSCLMTPCEVPLAKENSVSNTLNRNYLQLAIENETVQERYFTWLRRIRKKKEDDKLEPCPQ